MKQKTCGSVSKAVLVLDVWTYNYMAQTLLVVVNKHIEWDNRDFTTPVIMLHSH